MTKTAYNLKNFDKMHKRCSHCDEDFEREPGFYFGAMYTSYGPVSYTHLDVYKRQTLHESGLTGFDIITWNVVQGPRGIPLPLQTRLNLAAMEALAEPELLRRLTVAGIDPADPSTPESTRAFVAAEIAKFRGIVRETGLSMGRG